MKKVIKIFIYICGIALVIGFGVWSELTSDQYPRLQNQKAHSAK